MDATQVAELDRQFRKGLITEDEYDRALLALVTPEERASAEARVDAAMEAKLA
jgi:hypothetical protein